MTELVNVTAAPWQDEVSNKLDFSTGTYTTSTTEETHNSFLPSLGGSILESLPPVLESGPWIEKPPVASVPDWEDLEKVDSPDGDGETVVEEGDWEDYYQWGDRPSEVYEIEIEQRLPTSQDSAGASSTIFRPGLVIDDPSLIESIVTNPDSTNYQSDQLEDQLQEEAEQALAVGTIEEVPILEYSDYFPISSYQEESDTFQFDPYDNLVNTGRDYIFQTINKEEDHSKSFSRIR